MFAVGIKKNRSSEERERFRSQKTLRSVGHSQVAQSSGAARGLGSPIEEVLVGPCVAHGWRKGRRRGPVLQENSQGEHAVQSREEELGSPVIFLCVEESCVACNSFGRKWNMSQKEGVYGVIFPCA